MKKNLFLIGVTILLASCIDSEDLYDPSKVKEDAKQNFPVENVDPTQDWATRGTRTLDVIVNETAGQTYTIKVFTANPLKEDENPRLLAQTEVKDGVKASLKFDVSLSLDYVYVMCKAGEKDYAVSAAPLVDNKFVASFGKSATTRAGYDLVGGIEVDEAVYACPDDADDMMEGVSDNQFVSMGGGNYKVAKGESVILDKIGFMGSSTARLYISGTLEVTSLQMRDSDASISVLKGGTLIVKDALTIANKGTFYNAGTVDVKKATLVTGVKWLNDGVYKGGTLYFQTKEVVAQNNCRLEIDELKLFAATFNNGGYVKCRSFVFIQDAKLNLSGKSVFDVQGTADLGVGTITGPTAKPYPLFRANTLKQYDSQQVIVNNTVYTTEGVNSFFASKFKVVKATIGTLPEGDCVPPVSTDDDDTENIPVSGCTIGFEDVSAKTVTDYDFNDVVLWVSNPVNDVSKIYLVAAGATNNIKVGYMLNSTKKYLWGGKEVHELLGVSTGAMFNTSGMVVTENLPMYELQITASVLEKLNFFIEVNGKTDNLIFSKNDKEYIGGVPFGICVSEDWNFPIERTRIDEAYKGFGEWGKDKNTNLDWYKNGNAELTCPFNSALLK